MEKGGSVRYEGSEKMQQKAGFFGTRKPAVEEDKEVWVVLHICDPVRIMSFVSLKIQLIFSSKSR